MRVGSLSARASALAWMAGGDLALSMASFRVRSFVFTLLFGFAFTGYVQRTSVAIAAERMMPELGLTQIEVGWLLTAFLFSY